MTKQEMIERLVDASIDNFFDRDDPADYLSHLFRAGITGFNQMSDKEIENEYFDTFGEDDDA